MTHEQTNEQLVARAKDVRNDPRQLDRNTHARPLISVGMPVYNGEKFLRQALESLLCQDYPHFELILSDNASEDLTEEICREYAARDARIRYIRQSENRGAPWNFAFVAKEAHGKYFLWAAHDDQWHPTFLRKCMATLESHPEALLCCTEIDFVDSNGLPSAYYPNYINIDTLGMAVVDRIHALMSLPGWFAIYGLMRREVLQEISLGLNTYAWDVILLLEILLVGPTAKVQEMLFTVRIEPKTPDEYAQSFKSHSAVSNTPYTGAAVHLLQTVYNSQLSSQEKTLAFAHFILDCQCLPWRPMMVSELLGVNFDIDDKQFSLLVGLVLSRCVPFAELEHNPLCEAMYRSLLIRPDLLCIARRVLSNAPSFR